MVDEFVSGVGVAAAPSHSHHGSVNWKNNKKKQNKTIKKQIKKSNNKKTSKINGCFLYASFGFFGGCWLQEWGAAFGEPGGCELTGLILYFYFGFQFLNS